MLPHIALLYVVLNGEWVPEARVVTMRRVSLMTALLCMF